MSKRNSRFALGHLAIPIVIGSLVGGCLGPREDPSRFFLLTAPPSEGSGGAAGSGQATIVVGPLELPGYLTGPMLVTRVDDNEVVVSSHERWAEPLDDNITRVLADNLSAELRSRIEVFPTLLSERVRLRIPITIVRFDRDSTGNVELRARWRVEDTEARETLERRDSRISQPTLGTDGEAGVRAMSGALLSLSREIAATIRRLTAP